MHVETLAKQGKKQIVPEGLYDALIAVVDLLQKMVTYAATSINNSGSVCAQHRYRSSAVTPCCTKPKPGLRVREFLCTLFS